MLFWRDDTIALQVNLCVPRWQHAALYKAFLPRSPQTAVWTGRAPRWRVQAECVTRRLWKHPHQTLTFVFICFLNKNNLKMWYTINPSVQTPVPGGVQGSRSSVHGTSGADRSSVLCSKVLQRGQSSMMWRGPCSSRALRPAALPKKADGKKKFNATANCHKKKPSRSFKVTHLRCVRENVRKRLVPIVQSQD